MRKTLIAMLGLATSVMWAMPALAGLAGDPPKLREHVPLDGRAGAIGALAKNGNYTATLSGTVVKQASATTVWFMYPGACQQRALGTWAPKTVIQADSLDTYAVGTLGGYSREDLSLKERLWHKVTSAVPSGQRPAIIAGTASLWAGRYDVNWVVPVGYPNITRQILYIDTGNHGANWTLNLKMNQSTEQAYDFVYLIGGSGGGDPLGNSGAKIDELLATGASGTNLHTRVIWTGSILTSTPGALSINATGAPVAVTGSGSGQPSPIVPVAIQMPAGERDVYVVFTADCLYSSEDGLWSFGNGVIWDDITASDNGVIFADGTAPVGADPFSGDVIQGAWGNQGYIAARVTPGVGELWQIVDGSTAATSDNCQPQKNDAADHMFFGADASSKRTIPGQYNAIISCSFPVPAGTASIFALWGEYLDLPGGSGFVQDSEYRFFRPPTGWSNWQDTDASGGVITSTIKVWTVDGNELAAAVQADSVQVRYKLQCIPGFATDRVNCGQVDYGILYDDFYMEVVTGVPAPIIAAAPGAVAQTTFVDGTMTGVNCSTPPCWPGIRGTDVPPTPGNSNTDIRDNFNSPFGDSIMVNLVTGLRKNGMGINWKQGFDRNVNEGLTIAHTNGSYNAAFDQPRVIYRLFDPATKTWSPFDSSALDANAIQISGIDTVIIDSEYRMNWPPRDKAGLNLPGGFTMNGVAAYNNLRFLPRGTRLQYYWKAVDINGGVSYLFSTDNLAREVEDLPTLPGGSAKAPDIIEFNVLPRVYAAGSAGSLLAGRTTTPILNLDGSYSVWSFQQDPVTQALRGMGVRADRYRLTQNLRNASNFGGLELTGPPDNQRPDRGSNFFPNMTQYSIRDSLSNWYRVLIQSSHLRTATLDDEPDARLAEEWWVSSTGTNGGDRCMFTSGDDYFNSLMNAVAGDPSPRRRSFGQNVMGVNSAAGSWNGQGSVPYPTVEDRFANPGSGPGLLAGFSYPVDGGCPGPNRFDALTKVGSSDAQNSAFYPLFAGVNDVAGIAMHAERDPVTDNDRNKALGYGFSIQYVRKAGIPTNAANYVHSGVENRMQILYKFLASCRGPRSGAAADTAKCWPCPTDANISGNWAALSGFQTGQYGPLYAIQDNQAATGVEISEASAAPRVNKLDGNFPNPFNPQTRIKFSSAQAGKVTIRIFNVGGQLVRTLSTKAEAGANEVRWNGRRDDGASLASGVYFYKIKFADGTESGSRMALVK
jgi:hypothetical protein